MKNSLLCVTLIFSGTFLYGASSSSGPSFETTRLTSMLSPYDNIIGAASAKPGNKRAHEDRFLVLPNMLGGDSEFPQALCAVIDGYQGPYAADKTLEIFPRVLEERIRTGLTTIASAQKWRTADYVVKTALTEAVEQTDAEYLQSFINAYKEAKARDPRARLNMTPFFGEEDRGFSGATMAAMFLSGSRFFVANVGDCSAIVTKRERNEEGFLAQRITAIHRPDDLTEYARVTGEGAQVGKNYWGTPVITPGNHAITRCLGSMELKAKYATYFSGSIPRVVSSTPEVCSGVQTRNDAALVLVSDGITDFIIPKETRDAIIAAYPLTVEEKVRLNITEAPKKDVDEDGEEEEESKSALPISDQAQKEIDRVVNNKIAEIVHEVRGQGGTPQDAADELVRFTLQNMDGKDDATALVVDLDRWYAHAEALCRTHHIGGPDEWETCAAEKPTEPTASYSCSIV